MVKNNQYKTTPIYKKS